MKKLQKGFTLIELMIVVAIIGILAAIAIPAYSDYIARAQTSEAVELLSGAKTPLAEFFADKGRYPSVLGSAVGTLAGKYVGSLTYKGSAPLIGVGTVVVLATMKVLASGVNRDVGGKVMALETRDGGKIWYCGKTVTTPGDTTFDEKFIPGACK